MLLKIDRVPETQAASILLAVSMLAFTLTPPAGLPVRIPLGLARMLFLPGYTFTAALLSPQGGSGWTGESSPPLRPEHRDCALS